MSILDSLFDSVFDSAVEFLDSGKLLVGGILLAVVVAVVIFKVFGFGSVLLLWLMVAGGVGALFYFLTSEG